MEKIATEKEEEVRYLVLGMLPLWPDTRLSATRRGIRERWRADQREGGGVSFLAYMRHRQHRRAVSSFFCYLGVMMGCYKRFLGFGCYPRRFIKGGGGYCRYCLYIQGRIWMESNGTGWDTDWMGTWKLELGAFFFSSVLCEASQSHSHEHGHGRDDDAGRQRAC